MDAAILRTLVREKLKDGRLPHDRTPRFWGAPADGEICDACGRLTDETGEYEVIGRPYTTASGGKTTWRGMYETVTVAPADPALVVATRKEAETLMVRVTCWPLGLEPRAGLTRAWRVAVVTS
jgi:hypothetical protein